MTALRQAVWMVVVGLIAAGGSFPLVSADEPQAAPDDLTIVQAHLKENVTGKWERGPLPIDTKAVRAAYSETKFFYVFSSAYPIARSDQVSLLLRLDKAGKVSPMNNPADYSFGLMPIGNADDAKTAGAAIMSLTFGPFGPMPVEEGEVEVSREGDTWVCTAGQPNGHRYRVVLDAAGKCTEADHDFGGPLPICIGGLFQPVALADDIAGLGHPVGGALEVVSVEPDSIAARAGLQPGDVIVSFASRPLPQEDLIQGLREQVFPLKQQGHVTRPITALRGTHVVNLTLTWETGLR